MLLVGLSNLYIFYLFDPKEKYGNNNSTTLHMLASFVDRNRSHTGEMNRLEHELETIDSLSDKHHESYVKEIEQSGGKASPMAGLSCSAYGGPSDKDASEMVFWSDIPSDNDFLSPFLDPDGNEKYMTFEPDSGGWNNIRMAMETVVVLAHATGRTLVLPPEKGIYLLGKTKKNDQNHKTQFTFNDFFNLDSIALEHKGFNVITMEEFLRRKQKLGDELKSVDSGKILQPPGGRINWNGEDLNPLWGYLRKVGVSPQWNPSTCVGVIPSDQSSERIDELNGMMQDIVDGKYGPIPDPDDKDFLGDPTDVDAEPVLRLREIMAQRTKLCIYDDEMNNAELIHMKNDRSGKESTRLLTHFYAFLFFQDWRQDLWSKRFVRDHLRYIDEIMCAAARIVKEVRKRARENASKYNPNGLYDGFHVRRGDFQYKKTRIGTYLLHKQSEDQLEEGSTLYIATDEKDKSFFDPLKKHYDITFLDDYMDVIQDINPNYYGMLDQLVVYKSRVFFGTWWSTLTGYVNRMRGYYITKHKLDGFKDGTMKSYYFVPEEKKFQMTQYRAVKLPIYMREFPTSWRDIDRSLDNLN
eukprot:CAMPEP_0184858704 /NCGR_PEP_ID=MMETSP0580-20130426/3790_1 /TAXON_ID=1118495 /ORGANISM="Dactyliosolen fragilissimus" /LENGTH=580 /DNA_ID=CAMNT_0027355005 /DNA_START=246 /DNA_END=1988 /DNA_ORIENTATION=-